MTCNLNDMHYNRARIERFCSQCCPDTIRYLARQALSLRGDWNTKTMSEENSNFHYLLNVRAQENPEIIEWHRRRDEKYTSPEIQNELLEAMALGMMPQISANIQYATFFTIMADETADLSNQEQLAICIGWADDCFMIHEDFVGMHPLEILWESCYSSCQQPMPLVNDRLQL